AIETENQGRLRLARRQIEMAQVDWVAAVSKADALLRELLRDRESGRKAESKRDNEKMREAHAAWAIPPARREGLLLQVLGDERLVIRELTDRLNAELRFPSSENRWYAVYQSHVRSLLMRMVREGQLERTPEMFKNKVRYRYSRKLPLEGPIVGLERTYQDDQDDQEGGE
ncbi:MAG: hypothetical protein M3071_23795, partial [Actinomycetota bacterium]|nr:hypothetical protein [Actinomycetota bacterium]